MKTYPKTDTAGANLVLAQRAHNKALEAKEAAILMHDADQGQLSWSTLQHADKIVAQTYGLVEKYRRQVEATS